MNKRIRKKYLSEEERIVLKLYRKCDSVDFWLYNAQTSKANHFVSILAESKFKESNSDMWFQADDGKICATGFIKEG
ncbi:hypothetical protein [Enterococcus sp. DIV0800]|uniref:hypothetical protein n=1 Tax=unclassified Enterococcus TaxID=2608891 RepID=UPI003D30146D